MNKNVMLAVILVVGCMASVSPASSMYLLSNNQIVEGGLLTTELRMPGTENVTYHYDTTDVGDGWHAAEDFFATGLDDHVNGLGNLIDGCGVAGGQVLQGDWWNSSAWGMVANIVFDLGQVYNIEQTQLFNLNPQWFDGVNSYTVRVNATNGGIGQSGWQTFGSKTGGIVRDGADIFNGDMQGRYVWINANAYGGFYQLWIDEIAIMGTPVPEPATMGLLVLGGLGLLRKRSK